MVVQLDTTSARSRGNYAVARAVYSLVLQASVGPDRVADDPVYDGEEHENAQRVI